MQNLHKITFQKINIHFPLIEIPLPEETAHIRRFFGLLDLSCSTWHSEKIRKIYFMNIQMKLLHFHMRSLSIYPAPDYDLPFFLSELTIMRKKLVMLVNIIPMFRDEEYMTRYIAPFKSLFERYTFPAKAIPEWMQTHSTLCTIYSMPKVIKLDDAFNCIMDYLDTYLDMFSRAKPVTDPVYKKMLIDAQEKYRQDIIYKDGSRKILAKLIGAERTDRIFRDVFV